MTGDRAGRNAAKLSRDIAGEVVTEVTPSDAGSISIHFTSGVVLVVRCAGDAVVAVLEGTGEPEAPTSSGPRPTRRQREYLEFIEKYVHRYGVAPAEIDIQRHFMVSAPSVNQMVRTLEARGFITRDRDRFGQTVPRSIRVVRDGH